MNSVKCSGGIVVSIMTAAAPAINGQIVVGPDVRVNDVVSPAKGYVETAIAVSRTNPLELIVAAIEQTLSPPGRKVHYGIELYGFTTAVPFQGKGTLGLASTQCLAPGATGMTDPMVAASPTTGDLWVGALADGTGNLGMITRRRQPGATTLDSEVEVVCEARTAGTDKPLMAAGPGTGGPGPFLYTVYTRGSDDGGACPSPILRNRMLAVRSDNMGASWLNAQPMLKQGGTAFCTDTQRGQGAAPIVIPSGLLQGRVVVAYLNRDPDLLPPPAPPGSTPLVPTVVFSNTMGAATSWSAPSVISQFVIGGGQPINIEPIEAIGGLDDLPGTFRAISFPGIAFDPNNPNTVYVVFSARKEPGSRNLDLFVARSLNGGATFPLGDVIRLGDAMLRDPNDDPDPVGSQPDEWMPWITVDGLGGINLVYYRTTTPDTNPQGEPTLIAHVAAHYARFTAYPPSGNGIYVKRISEVFPSDYPILGGGAGGQFLGDYMMIDAVGCNVYACYPAGEAATTSYSYFVRRILVCNADMNNDSMLTGEDVTIFAKALSAGDAKADVNLDKHVDTLDVAEFQATMVKGCQ